MKRLIHSAAAILVAFLALLLFSSAVRSGALTDWTALDAVEAAVKPERVGSAFDSRPGSSYLQSAPEYSLTRIVTITVGTSTVPLTPGLNSRWQIDIFSQQFLTGAIGLPPDASGIIVTVVNGEYGINYSGPTIYISNSQGLYYEYRTDQQALRFGNQILISQVYGFNRPLHYVGTVIFTDPYQYVGYAGYAPTQTNATVLHWDASFTRTQRNLFEAATWLVDPRLPATRPELEIITATLLNQLNHIYVTADIRNNGPMTAWAPVYVNLYDRIAPSIPPTGPLDLKDGWCSLTPVSWCGGGAKNPLPAILPYQTVIFTAVYDLKAISGRHDIYLFVDALGGSNGLNVESAETNNSLLAGSTPWWVSSVFLPLIRR